MHKHFGRVLLLFQTIPVLISLAHAQSTILDLPRPSQHAVVTQRIGITDITLNYHRPLVNGRKIWGGLVTYGQVWRAGANENTTITFTDPVTVEGKQLPTGTLRWEKLAVPFKVGVNTNEIVQASLHNQLRGLAQYAWFGWDDAATYLVTNKLNMEEALRYEDQSIQNEERFDNLITKSQVL